MVKIKFLKYNVIRDKICRQAIDHRLLCYGYPYDHMKHKAAKIKK